MRPAPLNPARLTLAAAFALLATGAAAAPSSQELATCAAIQDPARRLTCYDELMRRDAARDRPGEPLAMRRTDAFPGTDPAPAQSAPVARAAVPPDLRPAPAPEADADEVRAQIVRVAFDVEGRAIIGLDNGQTWHQRDDDRVAVRRGDRDLTAIVRRTILGGTFMEIEGGRGYFRVQPYRRG